MSKKNVFNLYPLDYPFETLVTRVESQEIILNPEFQRKYKWDNVRASRFIESALMRIPLPACYFAESERNDELVLLVIDGVQRITTIKRFFDDEFALEGLTFFPDLNGKKFSELGLTKSELKTTSIRCIVLRQENPDELIPEIFARLNQGAVQLTAQEIRHAIYPGVLNNLLVELSRDPVVKKLKVNNKQGDRGGQELVLRYFALNQSLNDYDSNFSRWLDAFMRENKDASDEKIKELKEDFLSTLEKCKLVFGDSPFGDPTANRQRQGLVYYDLLMHGFRLLTLEFIQANKEQIRTKFEELCESQAFKDAKQGGLQRKASIENRRELWTNKLREIQGYDK